MRVELRSFCTLMTDRVGDDCLHASVFGLDGGYEHDGSALHHRPR